MRNPDRSRALYDQASPFVSPPWADPKKAIPLLEEALRADDRNIRAYKSLATVYFFEVKDLARAEEYARTGLAVTDPPDVIVGKQVGSEPLAEAIRDGLYSVLFAISLKRGDLDEASSILQPLKAHWDKYQAGTYQVHRDELSKAMTSQPAPSGTGGCLVLIATVGGTLLAARLLL